MSDRQTPDFTTTRSALHTAWFKAMSAAYYPGCPNADYAHWLRTGEVWPGQKGAARGAAEYRDGQHAGVANSMQPTRGEPRSGGQAACKPFGDTPAPGNRQTPDADEGGVIDLRDSERFRRRRWRAAALSSPFAVAAAVQCIAAAKGIDILGPWLYAAGLMVTSWLAFEGFLLQAWGLEIIRKAEIVEKATGLNLVE